MEKFWLVLIKLITVNRTESLFFSFFWSCLCQSKIFLLNTTLLAFLRICFWILELPNYLAECWQYWTQCHCPVFLTPQGNPFSAFLDDFYFPRWLCPKEVPITAVLFIHAVLGMEYTCHVKAVLTQDSSYRMVMRRDYKHYVSFFSGAVVKHVELWFFKCKVSATFCRNSL